MFRPMRRHAQQLDQSQCERILTSEPRGVLSLLGDDSYPYGIPLDFAYCNNAIFFHCAKEGHKLDAVRAHDKASFCVMDQGTKNPDEWWFCFNSVIAFGRINQVSKEEDILDALHLIADKYFPSGYDVQSDIDRNLKRVVILRLDIEHVTGKFVREK